MVISSYIFTLIYRFLFSCTATQATLASLFKSYHFWFILNNNMTNYKKLHLEHDKYKEFNVSLEQKYDPKIKLWKFMGYRCNFCDAPLKTEYVIRKHQTLCRKIHNPPKYKVEEPETIVTTKGTIWEPKFTKFKKKPT